MEMVFDPLAVARNRLRAFSGSDRSAAFLFDLVASEMADRLSFIERHFDEAVELHGFNGATAAQAMETGKIGRMRRIEIPEIAVAAGTDMLAAPLEEVPLDLRSVNLVLSPLALHLTNDTPGLFIQIRRALMEDGLFMAAIPGAGTLRELRDVLLAAELELREGASPRVLPFADIRDVGSLLQRAGFALPVVDTEDYIVRYDTVFDLMKDLRHMGMANALAGRSRKFTSRRLFLRAAELYAERYSDADGRIRATFSIIYASGWAPHESQQKPLRPGSAKMRLEDALKGGTPGQGS